uniref:Putative double-stranded RNA-binding protein 4 isoform X3 n=2 Tax=Davidia involucrata TaxID=16924 RepID=A0A5B7AKU4_DAVIN
MSEQCTESQEHQSNMSEPEKTERPAQSSTNLPVPEHLLYKNRLQEYTHRSAIPLPIYQTINEGAQHAPKFRSTVLVDGSYYTSLNTFSHRKAAEQDVAKVALDGISQKRKDEGCPLIHEDTVFCKSILNEYAVKINLEKPTYTTIQWEGLLPVFVSSLVFNGVTYTGDAGRNKKEAEQLAARAVILSILGDSSSGNVISEIIKSKFRLYAALHKVKDSHNTHNGIMPVVVNTGSSFGTPLSKRKDVEVTGGTDNMPISAISATCSGQLTNILVTQPPLHEFKKPKLEPSSESITPIVFVPPVLQQPLVVGSTDGRKKNRKNKKKAKKKVQVDAQLPVAVLSMSQVPPCSVAQ